MGRNASRYRNLLLGRRAQLEEAAGAGGEATEAVELDQTRQGRLSRMDAMQQQAMAVELLRRRRQELSRIEGALARIDSGKYGYCVSCGEEIPGGRLEVDPAATQCIGCAGKRG